MYTVTASHTVPVPGRAATAAASTNPAHTGHPRSRNFSDVTLNAMWPTIQFAPTVVNQNDSRSETERNAQVPKGPR